MIIPELREFIRGAWALGFGWRLWMLLLVASNGIAPIFFLPQLTAIVAIIATLSAAVLALVLVRVQGSYTKLLGMIHAPWIPMLVVSIHQYPGPGPFDAYRTWLCCSIALTVGSLIIDATDVVKFLKATPALPSGSD